MKSTEVWLSVWKKWFLKQEIEKYEPAELNLFLERAYAEVRNKQDYEPKSFKVMVLSLDRYLKNKGYSLSRELISAKQVLHMKVKQLRLAGRGKRLNKARQLSEGKKRNSLEATSEKLGGKSTEPLIHIMRWLLTQ